ncbi:hypothetical protein VZT92_008390 [Zoarces viviparus]|uniref:Uncharacterized protein n=1 Tax=Zoarces viviparus TaxID=48416 RepID=A0AAW1FFN4_ZOAVI
MCVYSEGCTKDAQDLSGVASAPSTHSASQAKFSPYGPNGQEQFAIQNIWPRWKRVNICIGGWLRTMAPVSPLFATLFTCGRGVLTERTPQPQVAAAIPGDTHTQPP